LFKKTINIHDLISLKSAELKCSKCHFKDPPITLADRFIRELNEGGGIVANEIHMIFQSGSSRYLSSWDCSRHHGFRMFENKIVSIHSHIYYFFGSISTSWYQKLALGVNDFVD
jgi:hypothetical protein